MGIIEIEKAVEEMVESTLTRAKISITCVEDAHKAKLVQDMILDTMKKVKAAFAPVIKATKDARNAAWDAHKVAVATKGKYLDPLEAARRKLFGDAAIFSWGEKQKAAQAQIEREAREAIEEEKKKEDWRHH